MMSLGTIRYLSREACAKAAQEQMKPYLVDEVDLEDWRAAVAAGDLPQLPFPHLGDLRPAGWRLVDEIFCDASGWGSESEPAMTVPTLIRKRLQPGMAYGITDVGQFQLYIGEFVRDESVREDEGVPEGEVYWCDACEQDRLFEETLGGVLECGWCGCPVDGVWCDHCCEHHGPDEACPNPPSEDV